MCALTCVSQPFPPPPSSKHFGPTGISGAIILFVNKDVFRHEVLQQISPFIS